MTHIDSLTPRQIAMIVGNIRKVMTTDDSRNITIDQATELVKKIIVRAPKALARYAKVKSAYDKAVDNYEAIDGIYIEMSYVVEALEGIGAYWTWSDMMADLADDLLAVENRRNELSRLIDDVEEQVADIDRNILSAFDDLSGNR